MGFFTKQESCSGLVGAISALIPLLWTSIGLYIYFDPIVDFERWGRINTFILFAVSILVTAACICVSSIIHHLLYTPKDNEEHEFPSVAGWCSLITIILACVLRYASNNWLKKTIPYKNLA